MYKREGLFHAIYYMIKALAKNVTFSGVYSVATEIIIEFIEEKLKLQQVVSNQTNFSFNITNAMKTGFVSLVITIVIRMIFWLYYHHTGEKGKRDHIFTSKALLFDLLNIIFASIAAVFTAPVWWQIAISVMIVQ